jgi:hypothetical protein
MMTLLMSFGTCVAKLSPFPKWNANLGYILASPNGTGLSEVMQVLPMAQTHKTTQMLQTTSLRNVVMLGARDFGTIVGWLSLMYVSPILNLVPTGTKTLTKS